MVLKKQQVDIYILSAIIIVGHQYSCNRTLGYAIESSGLVVGVGLSEK